jgi:hypothetical protein
MRTSTHTNRHAGARLAALVAVVIALSGCASAGSAPNSLSGGPAVDRGASSGSTAIGEAPLPQAAATAGPASGDGSSGPALDASRPDLLVIKTGALELQVKDVDAALAGAAKKIAALGGYASGSERSGDGENVSSTVTYRIPAAAWDDALEGLRGLAIKVVSESTQTQDVSGQVVDLAARITNLQVTERALQEIMVKATRIADVLAVQAELTRVRGDIEQATAEKAHLQEQAAFSTLSVRFGLQPEPAVVTSQKKFDPKSEIDRAAAALVELLQGVATAGIWFGIVWLPVLLVVGLVAVAVLLMVRRRRPSAGVASGGPGPGTGVTSNAVQPSVGGAEPTAAGEPPTD